MTMLDTVARCLGRELEKPRLNGNMPKSFSGIWQGKNSENESVMVTVLLLQPKILT